MKKNTWIIVGVIGVLVVLFLYSKKSAAGSTYTVGAPSASNNSVGDYLGTASGVLSGLSNAFGSGSSGDNDPGLEDDNGD